VSDERSWSQGRIGPEDDGDVLVGVALDAIHRVVIIAFPKPITWLGLPAAETRTLIASLQEKLAELEAL
jgi:hypothetical protein